MAVSRQGSFTRAARSLGISQPALSRQVQKLEQELGVVLFLRDAGRVRLTEAGAQVEQWAQGILSSRQALVERLGQATQALAGELRIAASTTPGEFLVPDLVAGFAARHPAVRPEVLITDSGQVIEELRGDRWDVGFVGARLAARDLVYDEVADDEVVLAAPRAHRLAGLGEVAPSELAGQPFIDREEGSATLHTVRAALAAGGLEFPSYRVVMVLSTSEGVLSAVERGHGLAWVSGRFLERRSSESVRALRLKGVSLRRPLYLVRWRRRPPPAPARAFAEWVLAQAGRAPER